MDKNLPSIFVYRVDESILVGKPQRKEPGEVTNQPLACMWVWGNLLLKNDLEFVFHAWRQLGDILYRLLGEMDGVVRHGSCPNTSSNDTVSPLCICSTDRFMLCRKPGVESNSMVSIMLS